MTMPRRVTIFGATGSIGQNTIDLTNLVPFDIAVPGNHAIPLFNILARMAWPRAAYRRWIARDTEPVAQRVADKPARPARDCRHIDRGEALCDRGAGTAGIHRLQPACRKRQTGR